MSRPNIEFVGRISDQDLAKMFSRAKAFIFPQEEDFGIIAIEAMASGKPLIAFRGGDIVEHVVEGREGIFFDEQTAESLIEALEKFRSENFNPQKIRERTFSFDREIFKGKIKNHIESSLARFKEKKLV